MPTKHSIGIPCAKQCRHFHDELCFLQLYNEEVHDLLSSDQTKLQIHESKESGIYVAGLREDIVTSAEHVLQLLYSGEKLRHFGETKMNKTSSRSHTIFRMVRFDSCHVADLLCAPAVKAGMQPISDCASGRFGSCTKMHLESVSHRFLSAYMHTE